MEVIVAVIIITIISTIVINCQMKGEKTEVNDYTPPSHIQSTYTHGPISVSFVSGDPNEYYLDGCRVTTLEGKNEWYTIKGFVDALSFTCRDIEKRMEEGKSENFQADKEKWHEFYARLRKNCIAQHMHNPLIGDRQPFYPTSWQSAAEEKLFAKIDSLCTSGAAVKEANAQREAKIMDCLERTPGRAMLRVKLVNSLAGTDKAEKEAYRKVCESLCTAGVLKKAHDSSNHLLLQKPEKARSRPKKPKPEPPIPSAQVSYDHIPSYTIYKVRRTVGFPENMNREARTCEFQSLSREERYRTSLTGCTCHAFNRKEPCKHMVALAAYLEEIYIGPVRM